MKREEGGPREMKRERMKKDVDKTVHLSGNADVVPQSGHRKR